MFCYNCGNRIEDDARFCLYCGASQAIEEVAAPVAPAAPVASAAPVAPVVPEIPDFPVAPVGRIDEIPPAAPAAQTEVLSAAEETIPQQDVLSQLIQATETPVAPIQPVYEAPAQPVYEAPAQPVVPVPEIPEIPDLPAPQTILEPPTVVLSDAEPFVPMPPVAPVVPVEPVAPVAPVAPVYEAPVAPVAPVYEDPVVPTPVVPTPIVPAAPAEPTAPYIAVAQEASVAVQQAPVYAAQPEEQPKKKKKWPVLLAVLIPLLLVLGFAGAVAGHYFTQGYWPIIEDPAVLATEDLVSVAMGGDFTNIRSLAPTEYWSVRLGESTQIQTQGQTWQTQVLPNLLQARFGANTGLTYKSFQPSYKPEVRESREATSAEMALVKAALTTYYQIPANRIEKVKYLQIDISITGKYDDGLKQEMKQEEILFAVKMDDTWYLLDETGNFAVEQIVTGLALYQNGIQ